MNTLENYDWKKAAGQMAAADNDVEKAFFDLAGSFIANKAAPIMRDPYRLGFEIVQKNEDNSRMVGIFAFRIAKGLFYAPAFFLNGEIKGTDLFYNHSEKTFKPLTEDWVKHFMEKDKQEQGTGVNRSERQKYPADLHLRRLAMPPFTHSTGKMAKVNILDAGISAARHLVGSGEAGQNAKKFIDSVPGMNPGEANGLSGLTGMLASTIHKAIPTALPAMTKSQSERFVLVSPDSEFLNIDSEDLWKAASSRDPLMDQFLNEDWEPILEKMASLEALRPLMKQFLLEDGGWAAMDKIAYAIENSFEFAERLLVHCSPEDFAPQELADSVKSASAPDADIEIIVGGLVDGLDKSAAESLFTTGFAFIDKRAEDKITTVFADGNPMSLETVSEPGLYKVLLRDGEETEAFCARESKERPLEDAECSNYPVQRLEYAGSGYFGQEDHAQTILVTKDGRTCCARMVLGHPVAKDGQHIDKLPDMLEKEMSSGKGYRIYDSKQGVLSDVIYCVGKTEKNGLTIYTVLPGKYESEKELKVNPDYDGCSIANGIIGTPGYFIEVGITDYNEPEDSERAGCSRNFSYKYCVPGDSDNVRQWIADAGLKKASLISHDEDGCFSFRADGGASSEHLDLIPMIAALASEMHIKCAAAQELVFTAKSKGSVSFWMEIPQDKRAGVIRRMAEPRFQTGSDAAFGIDVETPQRHVIPTVTEQTLAPEARIGDAYDPSQGAGPVPERNSEDAAPIEMLLNGSPQELAQFSQQDSVPHMFEHGVIGSLVDTYDSSAMIDKYLPDLEKALDRAGRILFLFYWKPGDYQDLYGTDDMTNLENKLLSNFKSWGDMVLDLIQKTKNKHRGNVPLTGATA